MKMKRLLPILALATVFTCTLWAAPKSVHPGAKKSASTTYRIMTDYEEAEKISKETKKPILLIFSGSDWCGWCVRLDEEVFSTKEFQRWAKDKMVVYVADFPRRKKLPGNQKAQNDKLMAKYRVRGFPTVFVISPEGEKIGETGYRKGGPKPYIKHLEQIIGK